ncbi:MAG: Clp protease N-terminal domain-containing protein [Acidimicrobiales bacterium]
MGPGALDRARDRRRADHAAARRRGGGRSGRFDLRSKRVLELSLREALRLKTRHIGPEHIGLAILREGEGVACRLLTDEGVDLAELGASWEAIALGATTR